MCRKKSCEQMESASFCLHVAELDLQEMSMITTHFWPVTGMLSLLVSQARLGEIERLQEARDAVRLELLKGQEKRRQLGTAEGPFHASPLNSQRLRRPESGASDRNPPFTQLCTPKVIRN